MNTKVAEMLAKAAGGPFGAIGSAGSAMKAPMGAFSGPGSKSNPAVPTAPKPAMGMQGAGRSLGAMIPPPSKMYGKPNVNSIGSGQRPSLPQMPPNMQSKSVQVPVPSPSAVGPSSLPQANPGTNAFGAPFQPGVDPMQGATNAFGGAMTTPKPQLRMNDAAPTPQSRQFAAQKEQQAARARLAGTQQRFGQGAGPYADQSVKGLQSYRSPSAPNPNVNPFGGPANPQVAGNGFGG